MLLHEQINQKELLRKIRRKEIKLGGNSKLKIYGKLNCKSGLRLKKENRVFFKDEEEALQNQYRPCANCMKEKYINWKRNAI
jgi:methylphosphotriester-DNA--protein-cysteine methyltransferase